MSTPSEASLRVTAHATSAPSSIYDTVQPASFVAGAHNANPYDSFSAISCATVGDCVAVGSYFAADNSNQPLIATSTNGVWSPVAPVQLSSELAALGSASASFSAVSCPSPGNCVAVGYMGSLAITDTSTNGVWGPATSANFDPSTPRSSDGPNDHFLAVSCASPGNCTAAGSYADGNFNVTPMTMTMTNGVWGTVTPILWPDDFDVMGNSSFNVLSCAAPGDCTAAGSQWGWRDGLESFTATSTNGAWATATVIHHFNLSGLSCTAPGACSAAGSARDSNGNDTATTVSSLQGVWGSLEQVVIDPSLQYPGYPSSGFSALSCASPGNCAAVGYYADTNWNYQPLMATSTNGVWSPVTLGTVASEAGNPILTADFSSVSCATATSCSAAGTAYDSQGNSVAVTTTEDHGVWERGVIATFDTGVSATPRNDFFTSISCGAPGSCTAAGGYTDANNNYPAMTQSFRAPVPSAPRDVTVDAAPGHAIVTWRSPAQLNGNSITGYRVTVRQAASNALTASIDVAPNVTQLVVSLPAKTFTFSVAAVVSSGAGDASAIVTARVASAAGVHVPPAPRALTVVIASGAVRLSWLPPVLSDGGSPIYQYAVRDGHGHGCVSGTDARRAVTQLSCVVTGLTNGSRYTFSVTATNIMGSSTPSSALTVIPASAPTSAPSVRVASLTPHRATLCVEAPRDMGGRPLLSYEASFNNGRTWQSLYYFTSGTEVWLGALHAGTTYDVLIRARNQIGTSPAAPVTFTLPRR